MDPRHKNRELVIKTKAGTEIKFSPQPTHISVHMEYISVLIVAPGGTRINAGWMNAHENALDYEPPDWEDKEIAAVIKYANLWKRMFKNSMTLEDWLKQYGS